MERTYAGTTVQLRRLASTRYFVASVIHKCVSCTVSTRLSARFVCNTQVPYFDTHSRMIGMQTGKSAQTLDNGLSHWVKGPSQRATFEGFYLQGKNHALQQFQYSRNVKDYGVLRCDENGPQASKPSSTSSTWLSVLSKPHALLTKGALH